MHTGKPSQKQNKYILTSHVFNHVNDELISFIIRLRCGGVGRGEGTHIAEDQDATMSFLERYLDTVETLPAELHKSVSSPPIHRISVLLVITVLFCP